MAAHLAHHHRCHYAAAVGDSGARRFRAAGSQEQVRGEKTERQAEVRKLEIGKAVERELKGGEAHLYAITLNGNSYFNAVVAQRGIDVVVVSAPGGKPLLEMDSPNGDKGDEPVAFISQRAGLYRLQIKSLEKAAPGGRYEIRVMEVRAASEKDRATLAGERLLREAAKLADEANGFRAQGKYDQALPLAERALSIREKALGGEHPLSAQALNNVAELYFLKGDYANAELFKRALAIREKTLGAEHPSTALSLYSLSWFYLAKGDTRQAIAFQIRANEIDERDLLRNLASGSERQKLAYLNRNSFHTDSTLSLHLQFAPADVEIRRAALTRLLRRKGRSLDAMMDAIAQLRRHASSADQSLLDQLAETRSQHANLVNKGVGREGLAQYKASLEALEAREEELENSISGRSAFIGARACRRQIQ